jgi:hypothetical protein
MELLERYIKDIAEDLKIDDFNIKQVQLTTPGKKHFWVARLIKHKIEIEKLKKDRFKLKKDLTEAAIEACPINLKIHTIEKTVNESDCITNLDYKIKELELIIELLEKTEKIFASLTYDIGNIVKIMTLEQTG